MESLVSMRENLIEVYIFIIAINLIPFSYFRRRGLRGWGNKTLVEYFTPIRGRKPTGLFCEYNFSHSVFIRCIPACRRQACNPCLRRSFGRSTCCRQAGVFQFYCLVIDRFYFILFKVGIVIFNVNYLITLLSKIKMELKKYAKNNLNLMIFKIFKNEPYDKFAFIKIGVKNLLNERDQKICLSVRLD